MSSREIAVQGLTLQCTDGGTAQITTPPEQIKVNSKGVYCGPQVVSVTNADNGSCHSASGTGTLNPTANCKGNSKAILRKNDQCTVTVNGTTSGGSPCSFSVTVTVLNAGSLAKCT